MRWSTPAVNSSTTAGSDSLGSTSSGPAGTWWTRRPGSTSTTGGRSADQARVNTSQATPERARAAVSSRTYTFMPPPSPVPGWANGDVCRERTASRRMAVRSYRRSPKCLRRGGPRRSGAGDAAGGARRLRRPDRSGGGRGLGLLPGAGLAALVLVVAAEGEVDADEGLLLLLADRLVGQDGAGQVERAGRRLEDPRLHVERLGGDAQRRSEERR